MPRISLPSIAPARQVESESPATTSPEQTTRSDGPNRGKRTAAGPPESGSAPKEKVPRIARSCDQCAGKNSKCSGFKPCYTCTTKGRECTYDRPYIRGIAQTPPPPPENDNGEARNWAKPFNEKGKEHRDKGWAHRACDHCRTHQLRCAGKLPCEECFKARVQCTFKMRARQRASGVLLPEPGGSDGENEDVSYQSLDRAGSAGSAPEILPLQLPTRYANEDIPPLVFLHKAWRRTALALEKGSRPAQSEQETAEPGQEAAQPTQEKPDLPELAIGDQPLDNSIPHAYPDALVKWFELQDKFTTGWTETFHFIHRLTVRSWTDVVYKNWSARVPLEYSIGQAKASIALMTMALGTMFNFTRWRPGVKERMWSWMYTLSNGDHLFQVTIRLTDSEPGPPTVESVQARLLQALYLLCTCRLGQAWFVFGNVVSMITALGLHRRRGRNRGLGPEVVIHPEYAKIQCERRTFWSAYVLDKQIAHMTGRPSFFNMDNIDQDLPDCVNDEDMGRAGPFRPHKGDCYLEALVEQAKLAQIIERVMREVYSLNDTSEEERLERAWKLATVIDEWKAQLPFLMGSMKVTLLELTYRRQAILLQFAYWHAQMLVYRPFMTAPYPWDREKKRIADIAIRNCIEAARSTLSVAILLARQQSERDMSHFHTIFYAHYVTYLACSIIYIIPHIRQRQKLLDTTPSGVPPRYHRADTDAKFYHQAQRALKALAQSTNRFSPARRWALILEELRDECTRQVPTDQAAPQDGDGGGSRDGDEDGDDDDDAQSPNAQLLEDALRAHWAADIARESLRENDVNDADADAEPVPTIVPRLWDQWKTADWLDFDAAAFGPISSFEKGDLPIAPRSS